MKRKEKGLNARDILYRKLKYTGKIYCSIDEMRCLGTLQVFSTLSAAYNQGIAWMLEDKNCGEFSDL